MDFFNKTRESIINAGSSFSQKASSVSGTVALSMKIKDDEKKLESDLAELGRVMMEQHTTEAQKLCPDLYANINQSAMILNKDKKELAICKGMVICPNCGAEQQQGILNCTMCGCNMQEISQIIADNHYEQKVCSVCGASLKPGSSFCTKCGTKIY